MIQPPYRNRTRKACKGTKRPRSVTIGSSINTKNILKIRYGTNAVQNQRFRRESVDKLPEVILNIQNGKYYTLVLYDPDSPKPAYLHWLVTNISTDDSNTVIPYEAPNPPTSHTHYHRYIFELLEQTGPICIDSIHRENFSIDTLKQKFNLKPISSPGFYIDPRA
jgi:phosphatidylethanolamine-binding protein (PEBP) family uncharacterized protein